MTMFADNVLVVKLFRCILAVEKDLFLLLITARAIVRMELVNWILIFGRVALELRETWVVQQAIVPLILVGCNHLGRKLRLLWGAFASFLDVSLALNLADFVSFLGAGKIKRVLWEMLEPAVVVEHSAVENAWI